MKTAWPRPRRKKGMVLDMIDSGDRQALYDVPQTALSPTNEAENKAWNSFYHSGRVEDYIRYAQLCHRHEAAATTAGAQNADQNTGVNH